MNNNKIAYCKIFPSIGISRVGDSKNPNENEGWFIGPELDNKTHAEKFILDSDGKVDEKRLEDFKYNNRDASFSFKDTEGKIKKQGTRFRIYGFDEKNNPVGEITSGETTKINWSVSLANKKASWFMFDGTENALNAFKGENEAILTNIRNPKIGKIELDSGKYVPNNDRVKFLEIHGYMYDENNKPINPAIQGVSINSGHKIKGKFKENFEIHLGELKTDDKGRLIVLGGNGYSDAIGAKGESIKDVRWIRNYANNNDWFDDISDGPVNAAVIIEGEEIEVRDGAWIIVAPTDFAPDVRNIVTLYDVMEEVAWNNKILQSTTTPLVRTPELTTFDGDIKPVLKAMHSQRWVNKRALKGHGSGKLGDFQDGNDPDLLLKELSPKNKDEDSPKGKLIREKILEHLRQPAYAYYKDGVFNPNQYENNLAKAQANSKFMPPLSGDEGDIVDDDPSTYLSLTYMQFERFKDWVANPYLDEDREPKIDNPVKAEIDCLVKTVLDNCAGGAFFPGIEMTCVSRVPSLYKEAFRIDQSEFEAGDITKYMALPWQADFWECQQHWWPAQRPDDIIPDENFDELFGKFTQDVGDNYEKVLFERVRWDRGLGNTQRPSSEYLINRLLPPVSEEATVNVSDYIDLLSGKIVELKDDKDKVQISWFDFDGLAGDFSKTHYRKRGIFKRLINSVNTASLPNPWRVQFLYQEVMDNYSGLYFTITIPSPEAALESDITNPKGRGKNKSIFQKQFDIKIEKKSLLEEGIDSFESLRQEWDFLKNKNPQLVTAVLKEYTQKVNFSLTDSAHEILTQYAAAYDAKLNNERAKNKDPEDPEKPLTIKEFIGELNRSVSDIEEQEYLYSDFTDTSDKYYIIRAVQMIEIATDYLYTISTNFSGDMGMVEDWKELGIVQNKKLEWEVDEDGEPKKISNKINYETGRSKYDGQSFRDYFYYLMNIEEYPDFLPYSKKITESMLSGAQQWIDNSVIEDSDHPESFIPYSKVGFHAKLEEIYEILKKQAAEAKGWRTDRNRETAIRRWYDNAVFNQTDGAWLRHISNTGNIDKVNSLLFEVWSDEIGNGDPYLHHGNLYTNLLQSVGIYLPPINSRKYADNPDIDESSYIASVFELCISQHSESYYPELIGMTLFLEWEVLSLVNGIKRTEYLGLDAHFWEMHVGIDNATHGHGAKAKEAVDIYLDKVLKESGEQAMQSEWKRIWRGFVAFAFSLSGANYFGNDLDISRKYKKNPQSEIIELIKRKAHYGGLNHSGKNLGGHRLNDLFDEPEIFVEELAASSYVVPGKPEESKLLNYLTTYEGPMYKVFDEKDLTHWKDWIIWLGKEGGTNKAKKYQTKAKSMYLLLQELREVARSVDGHNMHRIGGKVENVDGNDKYIQGRKIAKFFESGDIEELMKEFKTNENNGWVKPYYPDLSPLITELAKGNRPMGAVLDKRYPAIGNQIGRIIIMKWIEAGCPLLGEEDKMPEKELPTEFYNSKILLVQQKGIGAVH